MSSELEKWDIILPKTIEIDIIIPDLSFETIDTFDYINGRKKNTTEGIKKVKRNSHTYRTRWYFISRKVKERDNYQCQKCKITEENSLFFYGEYLEVHHIIPFKDSQNDKGANLITLCVKCHYQEHNKKYNGISYPSYIPQKG
jgi:predicted HNH restriction endonuclease